MAQLFRCIAIRTPQCRTAAEGQGKNLHHSTEKPKQDSEAALDPVALSMDLTSHHMNSTWIPASEAQPHGLFPPWDAHYSCTDGSVPTSLLYLLWPKAREWSAHQAVTTTREIPATAHQCVTSHSGRKGIGEFCGV